MVDRAPVGPALSARLNLVSAVLGRGSSGPNESAQEKQVAVARLQKYRDAGGEDLLWALLNKLEFLFDY